MQSVFLVLGLINNLYKPKLKIELIKVARICISASFYASWKEDEKEEQFISGNPG